MINLDLLAGLLDVVHFASNDGLAACENASDKKCKRQIALVL
ncbi:MAG: hypothetical protein ACTSVI_09250 [Promethearchaeota archaeon]